MSYVRAIFGQRSHILPAREAVRMAGERTLHDRPGAGFGGAENGKGAWGGRREKSGGGGAFKKKKKKSKKERNIE